MSLIKINEDAIGFAHALDRTQTNFLEDSHNSEMLRDYFSYNHLQN